MIFIFDWTFLAMMLVHISRIREVLLLISFHDWLSFHVVQIAIAFLLSINTHYDSLIVMSLIIIIHVCLISVRLKSSLIVSLISGGSRSIQVRFLSSFIALSIGVDHTTSSEWIIEILKFLILLGDVCGYLYGRIFRVDLNSGLLLFCWWVLEISELVCLIFILEG